MLYGFMQDHYNKLGRYLEALKIKSLETFLLLVTNPYKKKFSPVFHRLFVCFDGLKKGWLEGCQKIICVNPCFLKTFIGGQLLFVMGRDGNDQMYLTAWEIMEAENIDSWVWFFIKLQKCLALLEGNVVAVISYEHQVICNHNVYIKFLDIVYIDN